MQEPDPEKATLAKVIPTPNNGSAELVALQRDQVSSQNVILVSVKLCDLEHVPC